MELPQFSISRTADLPSGENRKNFPPISSTYNPVSTMIDPEQLYKTTEAAKLLRFHRNTILDMIESREIDVILPRRQGGHYKIPGYAIIEYLDKKKQEATAFKDL